MKGGEASALVLTLLLVGCASGGVYPVTSGAPALHSPPNNGTYIVWANHVSAEHQLTSLILAQGFRVVERASLQQILDEQVIRLTHTSQDLANILLVGRLAGASRVIFANVQTPRSYLPVTRVAIRSVAVDTAEVLWSGTAAFTQPVSSEELAVQVLVEVAMDRGTCRGAWVEYTGDNENGGCHPRRTLPADPMGMPWDKLNRG